MIDPVPHLLLAYGGVSQVSFEDIGRAIARQFWADGSPDHPNVTVQKAAASWMLASGALDRALVERKIQDSASQELAILEHSEPSLLQTYEVEGQYSIKHSTVERFNGGNPFTHYQATLVDYLDNEVAEGMARTKRDALRNLRTELARQYKTRADVVLAAIEKETP